MPAQLLTPEGLLALAVVIVIFSGLIYFFRFEVSEFELGMPPKVKFTRRAPAAKKPSLTAPNMPIVKTVVGDQIMVRDVSSGMTIPSPAQEPPATEEPKVFLSEKSLEEVVSYITSLKPLERDLIAEQSYVGRWVRWSGEIRNISSNSSSQKGGAFTVMVGDRGHGHALALLDFLLTERHLVEPLREGDRISYEAKITRAFSNGVYLADVTIIPTEEPSVVDVTPEHLMRFFEEPADIQAIRRAAEFIGEWIIARGRLAYVAASGQVVFADGSPVHAFFRKKEWVRRISRLSPGDDLTIRGQIVHIDRGSLLLDSCEFIEP